MENGCCKYNNIVVVPESGSSRLLGGDGSNSKDAIPFALCQSLFQFVFFILTCALFNPNSVEVWLLLKSEERIRSAIKMPCKTISENAGYDGAVVVQNVLANSEYNFRFNAQTGQYCDLVKNGIIDPTKVIRTALADAASVASLMNASLLMHLKRIPKWQKSDTQGPWAAMQGI